MKRLLFPIAGSSSVESGLGTALTVATDFLAQLDVVFCRRTFNSQVPLAAEDVRMDWLTHSAKEFEKAEKRRISDARKVFDRLIRERHVPYRQYPAPGNTPAASWEVARRSPTEELIHRAGATDLVVVGRSRDGVGEITRSLTETALFACGQPVLIAPRAAPASIGKRVLVGWNRSAPAARAVKSALSFLRQAEAVMLFMISTGAKKGPEPADIASYLSIHDIEVEVREVPPTGDPVSGRLLAEADRMQADLLVMGAFSHNRLREFVLGGVTRDILSSANLPVLMAH